MMRYWVAGTHMPPDDLTQRLTVLLKERAELIQDMVQQIERSKGDRN